MRKLMNKKLNKKGFTLMEMLIVVAIIAILVAIAIPTFTSSLNKARVSADEANLRAYYASVVADNLLNGTALPTATTTAVKTVAIDGVTYKLYGEYTISKSTTGDGIVFNYTGPNSVTATIPGGEAGAATP